MRWTVPESGEILYDKVYIYRSDTQTGTFSEIASQLISDNTYVDETGDTTKWYKVRFYNSTSFNWSNYSTAMLGGTFSGYCSINDIRDMTNISTSDISDTDVFSLIQRATIELNSFINVRIIRERIESIDATRENKIDGFNTNYYIKNWKEKYFADMDNDGDVDTSDIIVFAINTSTTPNVETLATISSIDIPNGKFVLNTAYPSNYELYVTYEWCYRNPSVPDPLIKLACTLLAAAYCYAKINVGRAPQVAFGNTRIYRHIDSFDVYYRRFLDIVNQINNRQVDYAEAEFEI